MRPRAAGPSGDAALAQLGAKQTLLKRYRWSYALIGVKGAKPGQAIERAAANQAVAVSIGRNLKDRNYGIAYSALTLRKQ